MTTNFPAVFLVGAATLLAACQPNQLHIEISTESNPATATLLQGTVRFDGRDDVQIQPRPLGSISLSEPWRSWASIDVSLVATDQGGCVLAQGTGHAIDQDPSQAVVHVPFVAAPDAAKCMPAQVTEQQLTIQRMGAGTIRSVPAGIDCEPTCAASYQRGTTVVLSAIPADGATFQGWSGDGCGGMEPVCSVTLGTDTTVGASFTNEQHTLFAGTDGNGSVQSQDGRINCGTTCRDDRYDHGTHVRLSAVPNAGFYFAGWTGDCSGMSLTCDVLMTQARSVAARFGRANQVFITSVAYSLDTVQGNGSGATAADRMISGADVLCAAHARSGGLTGTYRAWISSSTMDATARIKATGARGWVRPDGLPFTDQIDYGFPTLYPPELDEKMNNTNNAAAMTGTGETGAYAVAASCQGWTSRATSIGASVIGFSGQGGGRWSFSNYSACSDTYRIYCLGVDQRVVVQNPALPASRRIAFLSSANFDASSGVAGADALCNSDASAARAAGTLPAGGQFRAMLSTTTVPASARFDATLAVSICRPDGVRVAATHGQIFTASPKLIASINVDAKGAHLGYGWVTTGASNPVNTGSIDRTCRDWASRSATDQSDVGRFSSNGAEFFSDFGYTLPCSDKRPVICLEQS